MILFDFKNAFDLIDHRSLVRELGTYNISDAVISRILTDFLTSHKQLVKLGHGYFSKWGAVPAGVPQGAKLAPWLFIIMINELDIFDTDLWKYVDDTTISETISKNQDTLASRAIVDKFQLNETKCKEIFINFNTDNITSFDPVVVNVNGI